MALYLLKPVLWNTNQYRSPSGVRAAPRSYPGMHGFGHEEWNNSSRMKFKEGGQSFRAFHTEGVKQAPVDENTGQTFVLMIASHDRVQQLVGVGGNAMYIGADKDESERRRIAKLLDVKNLGRDAWQLPQVQRRFGHDAAKFRAHWNSDFTWVPNWLCPAEFFMWLDEPVTLDPHRIAGSTSLPRMFSAYKALTRHMAAEIMNTVPTAQRTPTWRRLLDAMRSAPEDPVTPQADEDGDKVTTRVTMTQARLGQGQFRDALMAQWGDRCAVTGLSCPELLRASHVKPWKSSSHRQRLDPNNGLLLAAHLDALFDKGLISFDDKGDMLMSSRIQANERTQLHLPRKLRVAPHSALMVYLQHHREELFDRPDGR
jgi:hypothetical protein